MKRHGVAFVAVSGSRRARIEAGTVEHNVVSYLLFNVAFITFDESDKYFAM